MSFKNCVIILIAGAVVWLLSDVYWTFMRYTSGWSYYKDKPLENILNLLRMVTPLAIIIFGLSLVNAKGQEVFDEEEEDV